MDATTLAAGLGGRKVGGGWMACCPAHDDRRPSLSIHCTEDGKALVHCHAGCEQQQVISTLRARGLWTDGPLPVSRPVWTHRPAQDDAKRSQAALAIWQAADAADGTLVEDYLSARGIKIPVPPMVRFHVGIKHPSGGAWPAMVALVTRGSDGIPLAIHRTFLARDGAGKAPVDPAKMMLGPCRGGCVRLGGLNDVLMVGEGIETCLAAMQAVGLTAWAALSTSGLRALDLPDDARDVIVLADGDTAGEAAARDCAWRWKREGRRVRIARAPQGMDFNDLLLDRAPRGQVAVR